MTTPLQILQQLENRYLENKHNNETLQNTITQLDMHVHSINFIPYQYLILSIKSSILRQIYENDNFVLDGYKQYIFYENTDGRPKKCVNQAILTYLISIDLNNTEISKLFHVHRNTVIRWRKEYNLNNVLNYIDDDNEIKTHLREILDTYPNLGELYARGILLSKGIKIKQKRLRIILKELKDTNPLNLNPIRRRKYKTRTANSM